MARTFNRRPVTIDGPDNSDIKNYTFNYEQWKGIDDGKNFLSVDQSTFSDAQNMYIDSEGLLSSRPSFKHTSLMNVYADTEVESIYRLHSEEYAMILCVGKKQYVSGKLVPTVWISYGFNDSCIIAYGSSAAYEVKYIDAYDKTYIFINNKYDENPVKLEIFDKNTLSKLSIEDVVKSIYVPTTKIFTGNNEEEGEETNLWTTSEKYLYYYNDVTGISGDANGKTLTWEGKTLTWNNDQIPLLVKEHYTLNTSVTIIAISSTGAIAWIDGNTLNYAVNGSTIYSWNLSTYIPSSYGDFVGGNIVNNIEFNDAANSIIMYTPYMAYIVSCVSTREDNTLSFPVPTPIIDIAGITLNEAGYDRVISATFTDEKFFAFFVDNTNNTALGSAGFHLYVNFGDTLRDIEYSTLTKDSSMYLFDATNSRSLRIAMNKKCVVVCGNGRILVESGQSYIRGASKLISAVQLATYSNPKKFSGIGVYDYLATGETGEESSGQTVFIPYNFTNGLLHLTNNTYTYYQICERSNNNTLQSIYSLRNTVLSDGSISASALANYNNFLSSEHFVDLRKVYGNINKLALSLSIGSGNYGKILDFTETIYDSTKSTANVKTISTKQLLESADTLYNQVISSSDAKIILTRFSTDTFELYYDKLGELQLPSSITDILYLNNYFFAINNVLYYTENRYNDDGEFLFYLPKRNRNEFDNTINKLHQLSEDTIAIFFTYEIHYAKYDSSLSTYRYYKSKLQFGLLPKGEVVTSDDSVTTYFGTSKGGIVALTYQDFVAATEQTTLRISDSVNDNDRLFFTNYPIKILKYRYWIIFYATISRVWVYDTRNQSWWKQTTKSSAGDGIKITQMFSSGANHIYFIADSHLYEINFPSYGVMKTETVYLDYGERPIEWYFKSQKLHLGAPNYFKSIQGMTFFDSAEDNYENIFDLETYAYRDKPYVNGEQNVHYDVRMIRTYLLRMHTMKTNEFQFQIGSDNTIAQDELRHQLKLSSISIRYRITGEVR
jgi:hypothetical protein